MEFNHTNMRNNIKLWSVCLPSVERKENVLFVSVFLHLSIPPIKSSSLSAGPVVVSFSIVGGAIWKREILMTNPDSSMSCCSNQPAFGSTLLCVSGSVEEHGWCVCVCVREYVCVWRQKRRWGLVGSMCAKARLMLCAATEYKWRICQTAIFGSQ